jgi:ketosteroid isomerase-like protein
MEGPMAKRETLRRMIEEAYEARARGDVDKIMNAFHADGMFELVGDKKALSLTGAFKGQPSVRAAMTGFTSSFEFISREIVSMIVEGDDASVRSRLQVRFIPKDKKFTTEVVDLIKFKDGKIVELVEFADTALIKEIVS